MTTIYGIKNCDTMKKAMTWLDENGVKYEFHDYRKDGVPAPVIKSAIKTHGWETVINKRGTTWRRLPDEDKAAMDDAGALKAATEAPALIKRPLLAHDGDTYFGFKPDIYSDVFA